MMIYWICEEVCSIIQESHSLDSSNLLHIIILDRFICSTRVIQSGRVGNVPVVDRFFHNSVDKQFLIVLINSKKVLRN